MSMKIKPEAVASIRKIAAVCQRKNLSTKQAGLDRFVQGYLTIFHLWEDEEALREMADYVPHGRLRDDLLERAENLSRNGGIS